MLKVVSIVMQCLVINKMFNKKAYLTTALLKYKNVFVKCSNKMVFDRNWLYSLGEPETDIFILFVV